MDFSEYLSQNYEEINKRVWQLKDELEGIPYLHNGRSYKGVDCLGLVYLFFKELGVEVPINDNQGYISDDWYQVEPQRYEKGLKTIGEEVGDYRKLQILDVPYFRLYKNVVTHTAVMLDEKHFIHILIDKEVRVDSFDRRYWRAKYAGARRLF